MPVPPPSLPDGRVDSLLLRFRRARLLASGQLPEASRLPVSPGNGSAPLLLHKEGASPVSTAWWAGPLSWVGLGSPWRWSQVPVLTTD